jgi:N-acetylmuramoyl-L-alanine amidase-like protein
MKRWALAAMVVALWAGGCGGGSEPTPPPKRPSTSPAVDLGQNPPAPPETSTATAPSPGSEAEPPPEAAVPRPPIKQLRIPFSETRKQETARYSKRHYGRDTYRLAHPRVIVEHMSGSSSGREAYATFAPDHPDAVLHELPNVCVHFLVDGEGKIFQLVSLRLICRHTIGLNYTSVGVAHVGEKDDDVFGNDRQFKASLKLARWLRCRLDIPVKNVIGNAESLDSPYHEERVARLKKQTFTDFPPSSMDRYRKRLAKLSCA